MTEQEQQKIRRHVPKSEYARHCFDGQKQDEVALLVLRKHWIVVLVIWIKMIFLMVVPFAVFLAVMQWYPDLWDSSFTKLVLVLVHLYALFILLWYFIQWLDNHLDLIIVTNQRIVDINQTRIFNRKKAETSLSQVQDVSGQVKGMLSYFLRYGTLKILTASAEANVFEMRYVYRVSIVTSQILALRDAYLRNMGSQGAGSVTTPAAHA